ncbi:MAG: MBL fold metallo-hydrolase [Thermoplasmata archaeon]|nr:MBL fold metallo-hydrolase [Thermoplasmata archaeon]
MKLTILGSGGFRRTPRPGCHCPICEDARKNKTQRLGCSLFLHDENILFDTPEEIAAELENAGIEKIDHLFFTHWHPDHTLGARILEIMNTKWSEKLEWRMVARAKTQVYMPGPVHDEIMSRFGPFFEFWEMLGIAHINKMNGSVQAGKVKVEAVIIKTMHRTMTHSTAYIVSNGESKFVYAPCDITPFPEDERFRDCVLMILQAGWHGPEMAERARNGPHYEISLDEIVEIAKKYTPGRVILTHIGDEVGLLPDDIKLLEKKYAWMNLEFAYDGMEIEI